jgi:hypothetical protein
MTNANVQNAPEQGLAAYEKDLAGYLQERIKPGLRSSAIPLLARSIAKDLARRQPPASSEGEDVHADEERPDAQADEEGPDAQADEEGPDAQADEERPDAQADEERPDAQADEEREAQEVPDAQAGDEQPDAQADDEQPDFEAEMHELQTELGDEWILRFSVQGGDGWLTAETQDGTQRVEAPDAQRLVPIVDAITEGGGRP